MGRWVGIPYTAPSGSHGRSGSHRSSLSVQENRTSDCPVSSPAGFYLHGMPEHRGAWIMQG